MHRFAKAGQYWWQKPLVRVASQTMPAELAILAHELQSEERGVWLNSRGRTSGVVELLPWTAKEGPTFRTRRAPLPLFVAAGLEDIYRAAGVVKGCPDLVIWRTDPEAFRLIEVKCRGRDRTSVEQERFIAAAGKRGIDARIVEWEFEDETAA